MPTHSVIDLGGLPPGADAVRRVLLSAPFAATLHCGSDLITVHPAELGPGPSWVRLRLRLRHLEDGTVILTELCLRGAGQETRIAVRALVKAGSVPAVPTIRVPHDAGTIAQAYAMADPGDCLLIDGGTWEAGLTVDKPIVIRAADGTRVTLWGDHRPALTVRADLTLVGLALIGKDADFCLVCEGGSLKMANGSVSGPQGGGLCLRGTGMSELESVEAMDCRGVGVQVQDQSSVKLTACQIHHNRGSNLRSGPGTWVGAVRCGFQRSRSGSGIVGAGKIHMKDCIAFGNAHFGLFLEGDAQAYVQGGMFDQNGRAAIRAAGASRVTLDKVRMPSGEDATQITADPGATVVTAL